MFIALGIMFDIGFERQHRYRAAAPRRALALGFLAIALVVLHAPPAASAAQPLATAIVDPFAFMGTDRDVALARTHRAGANFAVIEIFWSWLSPKGNPPPNFVATNPDDPGYYWANIDAQVKAARRHSLEPILGISDTPTWAQSDPSIPNYNPDPQQLKAFAHAAATRYSGSFRGLPRVRYWIAWNEPNLNFFLAPQDAGAPDRYRAMLNAFADGVKSVHVSNLVVAGQLAPFATHYKGAIATSPLRFMRGLLSRRTRFDIWSYHPYTVGGPTDRARVKGDISLGDIRRANRLVRQARRAHRIRSAGPIRFWVTEFSWDSKPPGPHAVPQKLLTRWVAETLYRLWRSNVSLMTWFLLHDYARPAPASGLYYHGRTISRDRPKASLAAFRFPFVAYSSGGTVRFWGRTPNGKQSAVVIEQLVNGRWSERKRLGTGRYGIFTGTVGAQGHGPLRARLRGSGIHSPGFSLTRPPDLLVQPFG